MNGKIINAFLLFVGVFLVIQANSQCLNQVTNISGTSMVIGVNVGVTSTGSVDTITTYCPEVTSPFFIGYNSVTGSNNGSYTFDFSPAIDSLTLNFSGISNAGIGQEVVILNVNGDHYSIPNPGILNGCEDLATLTPNGDITGCDECSVSGWIGTTIPGPINSLSVLDSALWGQGNGAVFSLYICAPVTSGIAINEFSNLNIFPNPATDLITISGLIGNNVKLRMQNSFGQNIALSPIIKNESTFINASNLSRGIYFIIIEVNGEIETRKVIVK